MSKERELLGRWHNGDLLPEEYMQLMKETKELLAQPDINTQYLLDQVARLTAENAMLKEKWLAQPETLTPRQGLEEYKKGYARAELYLKREPLSEQAIWNANTEQLFEEGVRWAEQQHRIIGEDDE